MNQEVKFLALGGLAENGKNMFVVEINKKIFIIDAGFKFPEVETLGVDIIIPDFDYLVKNQNRISAIIITHGHDDVMAALPYLLEEINAPIYAPTLTGELIYEIVNRHNRINHTNIKANINRVRRNSKIFVDGTEVVFFSLTHSTPGAVGVALETENGYVVYSGEYIIDFGAPSGFQSDISRMMEISRKGTLCLLAESAGAHRNGYTSPNHKLTEKIESIFEETTDRIIISTYSQNIFRIKEIIELAKKYNRRIVFYGKDQYDHTNSLLRVGKHQSHPILDIPKENLADRKAIERNDQNLIVLLTGSPKRIYHDIAEIVNGGDDSLRIKDTDTFIVASPILPGTGSIANTVINELYKTDAKIKILKSKELLSMHAAKEDLKMTLQIFKPKYYIPIKGDYSEMVANASIAEEMNVPADNIIMLDNGEIITFIDGEYTGVRDYVELEDTMIDGIGVGDVGAKVIDDRVQLASDGVIVLGITISNQNKQIIASTDIQSRGFVFLKDSEYIIKEAVRLAEDTITEAAQKNLADYDVIFVRQMIRDKIAKYVYKETGKKPVILPVVLEV